MYPFIGVFSTNLGGLVRTDTMPDGALEYKRTYSTRIVVSARTGLDEDGSTWLQPEKDVATKICSDLTSLVHAALLQTPSCGHPKEVYMEETTLVADFLEPVMPNSQAKRWIASSVSTADFKLTEYTYALPYGTADTITRTFDLLVP